MGVFLWHQWARLVSLTAGIYGMWAGFWGILFRKFFWDFIGGQLVAPPPGAANPFSGGMITAKSAAPFVAIIVTVPVLQILTIIMSLVLTLLEASLSFPPHSFLPASLAVANYEEIANLPELYL
ncbi:hypothetical protein FRC06_011038 [Ceratobasidium sp. 370]|nr:hypothetical protein FRC06_011038 [Ceratobasidium sp. 370]